MLTWPLGPPPVADPSAPSQRQARAWHILELRAWGGLKLKIPHEFWIRIPMAYSRLQTAGRWAGDQRCRMSSTLCFGLEDSHIPTFWLLLHSVRCML